MKNSLFVPLSCQQCGNDLKGGRDSLLYFCLECKRAYIMEDYPSFISLFAAIENIKPAEKIFYVPFYNIDGEFSYETEERIKVAIYNRVEKLGTIYYGAYYNLKSLYAEDLALLYALNNDKIKKTQKIREYPIANAFFPPKHLDKISRLIYLSYLDKFADVTNVKGIFKLNSFCCVLIPFDKEGNHFRELIFGKKIPFLKFLEPDE